MSPRDEFQDLRKSSGGEAVRHIVNAVLLMTEGIPPGALDDAVAYLDGMTKSNCWWAEYWLRDGLRKFVADRREIVNREASRGVPPTEGHPK